jgi:hypothetical protein
MPTSRASSVFMVVDQLPARDAAGEDERRVDPAGERANVGYICHPEAVRCRCGEASVDEITRPLTEWSRDSRPRPLAPRDAP